MSSIDTSGHGFPGLQSEYRVFSRNSGAVASENQEKQDDGKTLSSFGDSVEISPQSRVLSQTWRMQRVTEERDQFTSSVREKLESLVTSKRDLDGHINAVLKEAGIKLTEGEKLRVETSGGGKIAVGGIDDAEKRRKIEKALNDEAGLGQKVQQYNSTFRQVSSQLESDTGLSLQNLIAEQKGQRQGEFQAKYSDPDGTLHGVEVNKGLDQFSLFADNGDLEGMVEELGGASSIVYAAECKAAADPEGTLKDLMREAKQQTESIFDAKNAGFLEKMNEAKVTVDEEMRKDFMLDLSQATITVDSKGNIEIDGTVAGDRDKDKEGKEIIKSVMESMMQATDPTGEVVLFEEANQRLIDDYKLTFGDDAADDASIVSSIGKDAPIGDIRLSSPTKEKELDEAINEKANAVVAGMVDFEIETPFEFSVDNDGKLSIDNMPEGELERKQVEQALDIINANLTAENENDETYGELARLTNHRRAFLSGGLDAIRQPGEEGQTGSTVTSYNAAAAPTGVVTPVGVS